MLRFSNLGKVSQYVEKVADLGKRNLLFRVDVKHLYSIWQLCKSHEEYQLGLTAVNHFYNFGRQLSPEGVNKLFVFTMRCREYREAIKLLEGARDWLQAPPDMSLIYMLMSALISQRDYAAVKDVFKAVRSNWQLKPTDYLYKLCIESMLCLQEHPLEEALMVYCDSAIMDVPLPVDLHLLMLGKAAQCQRIYTLDCVMEQAEVDKEKEKLYSYTASYIRERLSRESYSPKRIIPPNRPL
ncbi:hypothetical protein BgAZ_300780 [Babesia gibsoni]|uniref:Uncharacterized protein n=1 Tax=Babesia gibsoni TaxID=33632 RepID=A0AAD8P8J9_BABGI|nr:hypothetical protein BgAZ_300780 [Babesia gibsoni]